MSAPADRPPVQADGLGGDQLQPQDSLIDRGVDDILDEGWSPPEQPYAPTLFVGAQRNSDRELEADPDGRLNVVLDDAEQRRSDAAERDSEFPQRREVGGARAGRLVAPDMGFGADTEADLIATDVGLDGGAASAEEAAEHIIDDLA